MRADVERLVESRGEALVALCADLVAAPSPNPPGDVTAPAKVLKAWLEAQGLPVEQLGPSAEKPNLVVDLRGAGPGRHLVLNGHLDTIPAGDHARWSVPVHELVRHPDGRLTGLGMGNMKGGTAALAVATACLAGLRTEWSGRLSYTAVGDEVTFGPDGAEWLLDARPDLKGDALICAEGPGHMTLAIAEKGLLWVEVSALSPPAQGMTTTKDRNATARLARIVAEIDGWNDHVVKPPAEVAVLSEHAGAHGLRLSANCGTLRAEGFVSQVATKAVAEIDFRIPPGLTLEEVEGRLDDLVRGHEGVSWRRIKGWDPSWTPAQSEICATVAKVCQALRHEPARPVVRLPASDAARWRARGVPALCFGPQPTLAAGIDDYVNERDLLDCAKIYVAAALDYLGKA